MNILPAPGVTTHWDWQASTYTSMRAWDEVWHGVHMVYRGRSMVLEGILLPLMRDAFS